MALFQGHPLDDYINFIRKNLTDAIEKIGRDVLQSSSVESLAEMYTQQFRLTTPTLGQPGVDPPDEALKSESQPIVVHVPFEGDEALLQLSPRSYPVFHHVDPTVRDGEIVIVYQVNKNRTEEFIKQMNEDVGRIGEALKGVEERVKYHNAELSAFAKTLIEQHKEQLAKQQAFANRLATLIPIRRRDDGTDRIVTPVQRKHVAITTKPTAKTVPASKPEPQIELRAYDEILDVITSMIRVVERSPAVFRKMEEEDLRTILLVALNGIFQGKATAETFNGEGKNDILIRDDDRNVFIAECLMWKGFEYVRGKLDNQLFRYATSTFAHFSRLSGWIFSWRAAGPLFILESVTNGKESGLCFNCHRRRASLSSSQGRSPDQLTSDSSICWWAPS